MAHQLHLQVVAEGIETTAELDFLKQSNADIIQGYYYSKPLLFDDFTHYLSTPVTGMEVS
jgi:EAL domain-containing protein (putative c-di-GMP-specific phosphodiesterase class I)